MSIEHTTHPLSQWLTPAAAPSRKPRERSARWSYRLLNVKGIPIRVHVTFFLLLGWVVADELQQQGSLNHVLIELLTVLVVFGCVVLHELGHALTARHFGVQTREITLLPVGGIAQLERAPEKPHQELMMAIAGPLVSLAIAAVCGALFSITHSLTELRPINVVSGPFLARLLWINVILAAFNLLPAFPMDGGRVLRAGLSIAIGRSRATAIATGIAEVLAVLLGLFGVLYNGILVFAAIFIWLAAQEEAARARLHAALREVHVSTAMLHPIVTLAPEDPLRVAAERAVRTLQQSFPVVANGRVVGLLTHADLIQGLSQVAGDVRVSEVMQHDFAATSETELLEAALERLPTCQGRALIVLREHEPVGLLTSANVDALLEIASASKAAHKA